MNNTKLLRVLFEITNFSVNNVMQAINYLFSEQQLLDTNVKSLVKVFWIIKNELLFGFINDNSIYLVLGGLPVQMHQ